jgi:16S rRNA (uracil1498-N3)-methyltransferase
MIGRTERSGAPPPGHRRYWAAEVDLAASRAWLEPTEARHALRVMRHRRGDRIEVIDGSGRLFEVEIGGYEDVQAGERRLATRIHVVHEPAPAAAPEPWLVQALIRPSRLEALIDGATQLGVEGIVLFAGERTAAPAGWTSIRQERLQRIMRAATTQSLGLRLPELRGPVSSAKLPQALAGFRLWVAHRPEVEACSQAPSATRARLEQPSMPGPASTATQPVPSADFPHALVVGPEGGLTDSEVAALIQSGGRILDLGPRRLRTETAALAGLTLLSAALRGGNAADLVTEFASGRSN